MEYVNFVPSHLFSEYSASIRVYLFKLEQQMIHNSSWRPFDVKPGKIEYYNKIIKDGGPVPMPSFQFYGRPESGILGVMDGRHRCYAFIDAGYTIIKIQTKPEHAERMRKLIGAP